MRRGGISKSFQRSWTQTEVRTTAIRPLLDFCYGKVSNFKQKSHQSLITISTSYLCELGFSYLSNIKNKKRERFKNTEE